MPAWSHQRFCLCPSHISECLHATQSLAHTSSVTVVYVVASETSHMNSFHPLPSVVPPSSSYRMCALGASVLRHQGQLQHHQVTISTLACIAFATSPFSCLHSISTPCSSPHRRLQVPTPLSASVIFRFALFRWPTPQERAPLNTRQLAPPRRAQPCTSWAPIQDHALRNMDITT